MNFKLVQCGVLNLRTNQYSTMAAAKAGPTQEEKGNEETFVLTDNGKLELLMYQEIDEVLEQKNAESVQKTGKPLSKSDSAKIKIQIKQKYKNIKNN